MARKFDPFNRKRQLFFGVPESIDITTGRPAPPVSFEPSEKVKDKISELKPAIDAVKQDDTTTPDTKLPSMHSLSAAIGKEALDNLVERHGSSEDRRLQAIRRLSGRELE